jgi:hypothetical protein
MVQDFRFAAQGRGNRVMKLSCHVFLTVGGK